MLTGRSCVLLCLVDESLNISILTCHHLLINAHSKAFLRTGPSAARVEDCKLTEKADQEGLPYPFDVK